VFGQAHIGQEVALGVLGGDLDAGCSVVGWRQFEAPTTRKRALMQIDLPQPLGRPRIGGDPHLDVVCWQDKVENDRHAGLPSKPMRGRSRRAVGAAPDA
jgi:hypothetical protein